MEDREEKKDQEFSDLKMTGTMFFAAGLRVVWAYKENGADGVLKMIQDPLGQAGLGPTVHMKRVELGQIKPAQILLQDSTASAVGGHVEEASVETLSTWNATSVPAQSSKPSTVKLALQTAWHGLGFLLFLYCVLAFPAQLARRIFKGSQESCE